MSLFSDFKKEMGLFYEPIFEKYTWVAIFLNIAGLFEGLLKLTLIVFLSLLGPFICFYGVLNDRKFR